MEIDVVLDVIEVMLYLIFHSVAQVFQMFDLFVGGVVGCQLGDARLQDEAQVHQIHGQRDLIFYVAQIQRVEVGGDEVFYIGAGAAPRLEDVPGNQELYGFPHCAAAYPEHLRQLEFVGQFVACLHGQLCDVLVQLLFHLLGQQGVFDARKR